MNPHARGLTATKAACAAWERGLGSAKDDVNQREARSRRSGRAMGAGRGGCQRRVGVAGADYWGGGRADSPRLHRVCCRVGALCARAAGAAGSGDGDDVGLLCRVAGGGAADVASRRERGGLDRAPTRIRRSHVFLRYVHIPPNDATHLRRAHPGDADGRPRAGDLLAGDDALYRHARLARRRRRRARRLPAVLHHQPSHPGDRVCRAGRGRGRAGRSRRRRAPVAATPHLVGDAPTNRWSLVWRA